MTRRRAAHPGGAVVDSALFLWLAFGSLDYLAGQVIGKSYSTIAVVAAVLIWRCVVPALRDWARAALGIRSPSRMFDE
jgi:hypothetical protein